MAPTFCWPLPGSSLRCINLPAAPHEVQYRPPSQASKAASQPAPLLRRRRRLPRVVRVGRLVEEAAARLGRRRAVAVVARDANRHRMPNCRASPSTSPFEGLALRLRALQLLPISAALATRPCLQQRGSGGLPRNTWRGSCVGQHQGVVPLAFKVGREQRVAVGLGGIWGMANPAPAPLRASTGGGFAGRSSSSRNAQTTGVLLRG